MTSFVKVSKVEEGTRLFRWFMRHYPVMPQREFHRLCHGGQIRLNSSRVSGKEFLREGDVIRIPPTIQSYAKQPEKKSGTGNNFSLSDLDVLRKSIVHNDSDIVVFNKPAGLAVQGGAGIRMSIDKMAAALFPYDKISLVHRLDKETSGLLVVAKNQKAAQVLSESFKKKTAHKEYLALLNGTVKQKCGVIDNFIVKGQMFDSAMRLNGGTGQKPQRAITEYKVLAQTGGNLSWVMFLPKTGRTHQLRLHSAFCLNAPIVGDDLYGTEKHLDNSVKDIFVTKNLFLFAYKITFQHPSTGKMITLKAELPSFMKTVTDFMELPLP